MTIPLIFAIIVGSLLIVIAWWIFFSGTTTPTTGPVPSADIVSNFNQYPLSLWFSDNITDFQDALGKNPYHYAIITSGGKLVYANYTTNENFMQFSEVIIAHAKGEAIITRDARRDWARLVFGVNAVPNDPVKRGGIRIVHVNAQLNPL